MKAHETSVSREWEWLANFYTHTKTFYAYICMYVCMHLYVCMYVTWLAQAAGACRRTIAECHANRWGSIHAGQMLNGLCVCLCVYDQYMYICTYIHCNRVCLCVCVYLFTSNYVQYILKPALSVHVYACVFVCMHTYIHMSLNTQGISCACVFVHLWLLIGFVVQNVDLSIEFNCV